jgi:peptide/nickel transport system permease protein
MTRGLMVDVLESDYIEMAVLKGIGRARMVFIHAAPNIVGPLAQAIALVCAYLAGGVVVVEYVFGFPGIGQGLVNAVTGRDLPAIQAAAILLAAFYVLLNLLADIFALLTTPRESAAKATA